MKQRGRIHPREVLYPFSQRGEKCPATVINVNSVFFFPVYPYDRRASKCHGSFYCWCSELSLTESCKRQVIYQGSEIHLMCLFPLNCHLRKKPKNISVLCNNVGRALSNKCRLSPGVHSHVSQGQTAIKDVSGLSMKTGRAMLLQILTSGESQAIQFTMRSHRSLNSQQFASAKPVIDICQRKRVVHVSTKAAGRWSRSSRARLEPQIQEEYCMCARRHMTSPLFLSMMYSFFFSKVRSVNLCFPAFVSFRLCRGSVC